MTPVYRGGNPEAQVLVVGEALIDIVHQPGARISPEHIGGSPTNVALGLGRLGRTVRLHTALGDDLRGRRIAAHLEMSGVVIDPRSWTLEETATAHAAIHPDGSAEYTFGVTWPRNSVRIEPCDQLLHVGSIGAYLEPGSQSVRAALAQVAPSVIVTFDPNIRPALLGSPASVRTVTDEFASCSDVVKLSDEDASWIYPGLDANSVAEHLLGMGARVVALTFGANGSLLRSRTATVEVPARQVRVQDTVGAGDSYMAGLIDSVLEEPSLLEVADNATLQRLGTRAAAASAVTVQRRGADLPTRDDLDRAMSSQQQYRAPK